MLEISDLSGGYGAVGVLHGISLTARGGAVTCIMGRNGAGKTTLLRAIMGQVRASTGTIRLNGTELQSLPAHEVPRHGIGYVPQGRRLFADLTVAENITIGLMTRRHGAAMREKVLTLFPRLRERLDQRAGTLSGGEQQMLAIARALCLDPAVLLLDEPTEGLQPSMIAAIRDTVMLLKTTGVATILVEQRVDAVLSMADQVAFLQNGRLAEICAAETLNPASPQFQSYVGV